ncbi:Gfo/Idh/MocA family protein [Curtobacterium ammoniigenes]|uniref:Gfo/Idh/MocA family protein n=1 Tax=Curtobacterium ammoniigenes TaxID=395387 RepID=UPI00082DBA7A|nr:Gfo/Idh/MocA family oxidoreductase [Curtobacterium ammoniigenes]
MTRAAVIGCGDISALHFAAIEAMPDVELVAVCDTDPGRLEAATAAHGVAGFDDHQRMIEAEHPDVVHVTTPHAEHAAIAIDALRAGVDVLLEKPLAHSRGAGARVVDAAAESGARLGVCFQNRYNTPVVAAKQLLESGALGPVLGANATVMWHRDAAYYADRPWRGRWRSAGGGLLMNQAIHTVDLLQWLVGDVERVRGGAATRVLGEVIEVEDTADIVLDHVGGAQSTFFGTLNNPVNAPVTVDVVTEGAVLSLRGALTVTYTDGRVETVEEDASASGPRAYWGASHERLIRDFYGGIGSGEPFWIDGREAQKTLDIIQTVYDASFPARPTND